MNRLAQETSPYLRQHRDNPVDWFPWGDEAFEKAKAEDKPILLSVGYSACHWCHVMAHESFEDPAVAELMNRLFVNIKVDREERPDVDAVYMTATQALTGQGGWPMTVFMTPEGEPFYAGTYFPKVDRHGLPGFPRVLEAIDEAWRTNREELHGHAAKLTEVVARSGALTGASGDLTAAPLDRVVDALAATFDQRHGGFGGAPKFPPGMTIDLLLRAHRRTGDERALDMATKTLDAMAAGGMYDHVGGGFHRYSTDAHWLVPHFEKMLYDQATLVRAYLHAYLVTGEARHALVVTETVDYVLRELRSPEGGFYSAQDADTEGEEGLFYVWDKAELAEAAGDDAEEAVAHWGVTEAGNFEGRNILFAPPGTGLNRRTPAVERARERLRAWRLRRTRPGLDDKVLMGWNGMFLAPLAEAAAVLGRTDWMEAARANGRFLLERMARPDGRLLRSWQQPSEGGGGGARHLGYAEDYAALLGALVTLAEVDDVAWLAPAGTVADGLCRLFPDEDGSFFTTGADASPLLTRPKDVFDNATPAANSLAAGALLRLGALTGEDRWEAAGRAAVGAVAGVAGNHPSAFADLLGALERAVSPPLEVAVVGPPEDPATAALAQVVRGRLLPAGVSVVAAPGAGADLTPLLAGRSLVDGRPAAYVCRRFACDRPVTDPADLAALLDRQN